MIEWLTANWQDIVNVSVIVVGAAKAIAMITPNETDNKIVGRILKLVDFVGLIGTKTKTKGKQK